MNRSERRELRLSLTVMKSLVRALPGEREDIYSFESECRTSHDSTLSARGSALGYIVQSGSPVRSATRRCSSVRELTSRPHGLVCSLITFWSCILALLTSLTTPYEPVFEYRLCRYDDSSARDPKSDECKSSADESS